MQRIRGAIQNVYIPLSFKYTANLKYASSINVMSRANKTFGNTDK